MFKKGDIVECVDDTGAMNHLTKGRHYCVAEDSYTHLGSTLTFVKVKGVKEEYGGWFAERFVLVPPAPEPIDPVFPMPIWHSLEPEEKLRHQWLVRRGEGNYFVTWAWYTEEEAKKMGYEAIRPIEETKRYPTAG